MSAWCCVGGGLALLAGPDSGQRQGQHERSKQQRSSHGARSPAAAEGAGGRCTDWGELTPAAIAHVLAALPFRERLLAASVCRSWAALVASAAAHEPQAPAGGAAEWALSRLQPHDLEAAEDCAQRRLQLCRAVHHVASAAVFCGPAGPDTLARLHGATRLHLLDPLCDVEARRLEPRPRGAPALGLRHLCSLRELSVSTCSPMVDWASLPAGLRCLHLNLGSGYSVKQLRSTCDALGATAGRLPELRHVSLGLELDALLRSSKGAALSGLSALTQLTSLALTDFQPCHPDSAAHEGYTIVPPVLQQLRGLRQADLRLCSGQNAQLAPAAGVPDVRLALTLARHEQTQFNRLPPSLVLVSGLTSLSVLMAEFEYEGGSGLYVFDASPLALCPRLRSLLLELHGSKCAQHDLRGLAALQGLEELVVLFKCPDVHDARPEAGSLSGSRSAGDGGGPGSAASDSSHGSSGLGRWLARTASSLLQRVLSGGAAQQPEPPLLAQERRGGHGAAAAAAASSSVLCEEWVLSLLDTALDQLRPEFALSVPRVSGRLLVATTSRLLLRQPELVAAAAQPMLLASHLQLDCTSGGDCWGGECLLRRLTPAALRGWVGRTWRPAGVELLEAARYPELGGYPGCRQRIDDKLLVAARRGVQGRQVVAALMAAVEERCYSYFA